MLTKKFALVAASAMLMTTVAFGTSARTAYAAPKVDCDAVMNEVSAGKKTKEIATDLNISTSSVYRCKRHAKAAAKAANKSMPQSKMGQEPPAMSAPSTAMSAPSPAMAAPAAAASPK